MTGAAKASLNGSRIMLRNRGFTFGCGPGVPCFTRCCRNADMYLYPYDIIRMKNRLGLSSEDFIKRHTLTAFRDNPHFPSVMLKMKPSEPHDCPFLDSDGCGIYADRPYSCRVYPLEPAMSRESGGQRMVVYFLARHPHCQGHDQGRKWSVAEWVRDQKLEAYLEMNAHWVEMDTLLRQPPWGDQGLENPALKMAFMACFSVDKFRQFVFESSFLRRFHLDEGRAKMVAESDGAALLLGFDWVKFLLTHSGPLELVRT